MKADHINVVAVLGSGIMGHGISQVALMSGYRVHLFDIKQIYLDKGIKTMKESSSRFLAKGKISDEQYQNLNSDSLKAFLDLKKTVQDADLIIEAIPEILSLKQEIFKEVDKFAPPHAILATNTSSIRISHIASATQRPDKFLGIHYFPPVLLKSLVEIIRGDQTSEKTMEVAWDFAIQTGRFPLRVEKDTPGFIANRVLSLPKAVLLGAILDHGIAEPEEIDAQWRVLTGDPFGPFEIMDYAGLDTFLNSGNYVAQELHADYAPSRVIQEKIKAGELGRKSGKGIYDYSQGNHRIDLSKTSNSIAAEDLMAVIINEATKLIEQGICSADDVDKAAIYGMGDKKGPMSFARRFQPKELSDRLNRLAELFDKDIFRPTRMIRECKNRFPV